MVKLLFMFSAFVAKQTPKFCEFITHCPPSVWLFGLCFYKLYGSILIFPFFLTFSYRKAAQGAFCPQKGLSK